MTKQLSTLINAVRASVIAAPHHCTAICYLPFVCAHVETIPFAPSVLNHLFGSQMSLACAYEIKYKLAIITKNEKDINEKFTTPRSFIFGQAAGCSFARASLILLLSYSMPILINCQLRAMISSKRAAK